MKITFRNLGQRNSSFTTSIKEISDIELYKICRDFIESEQLRFDYDAKTRKGAVIAYGRIAGEFEVHNNE